MTADRYNPSSFFIISSGCIKRFTPGQPLQTFLGDCEQTQSQPSSGNTSSTARFGILSKLVQYNRTKYAIADFYNSCVREYDSETDTIITIIGKCQPFSLQTEHVGDIRVGQNINPDKNFMGGITEMVLSEKGNYFLLHDLAYQRVTKYDLNSGYVSLLFSDFSAAAAIPNIHSILFNSDESEFYVTHSNGLSKVNVTTLEVTPILGTPVEEWRPPPVNLTTGDFVTATIDKVSPLMWLIPDKIIICASSKHQSLLVFNLVERKLLSSCTGKSAMAL